MRKFFKKTITNINIKIFLYIVLITGLLTFILPKITGGLYDLEPAGILSSASLAILSIILSIVFIGSTLLLQWNLFLKKSALNKKEIIFNAILSTTTPFLIFFGIIKSLCMKNRRTK